MAHLSINHLREPGSFFSIRKNYTFFEEKLTHRKCFGLFLDV